MKMIKIKTADLIGDQLDYAVATALGEAKYGMFSRFTRRLCANESCTSVRPLPEYSTDWAHGGPIIASMIESGEFGIEPGGMLGKVVASNINSDAMPYDDDWGKKLYRLPADTVLVAAMRAFVAVKLGDEVEVAEVEA